PATQEHLPELVSLFDLYRIFYKQISDKEGSKIFLKNRIKNNESVIFLAFYNGKPAGFTQLFTTFSSVGLSSVFILNDLYVDIEYRKKGVGEALLNKAKEYCIEKGYKGLALETSTENPAQRLYEKLGWQKDSECFHYFWTAPKA
ncbi:MAG: GNAT family N-acetyltransferase, partial [Bacteroidota bacterium]